MVWYSSSIPMLRLGLTAGTPSCMVSPLLRQEFEYPSALRAGRRRERARDRHLGDRIDDPAEVSGPTDSRPHPAPGS